MYHREGGFFPCIEGYWGEPLGEKNRALASPFASPLD